MTPEDDRFQYEDDNVYDDSMNQARSPRRLYGRQFRKRPGLIRSDPKFADDYCDELRELVAGAVETTCKFFLRAVMSLRPPSWANAVQELGRTEDVGIKVRGEDSAHNNTFVIDVHDIDISVVFGNDWQPPNKFSFQRIRFSSAVYMDWDKPKITECQDVEVFSKANDQKAPGRWETAVKMIKGDFQVLQNDG